MSLPSRERGLKYLMQNTADGDIRVAPLAGAWIEIGYQREILYDGNVAPLAGAWIEIGRRFRESTSGLSRSPRGSVD